MKQAGHGSTSRITKNKTGSSRGAFGQGHENSFEFCPLSRATVSSFGPA